MIAGVFSDIHGNIYAFERIWESLKSEKCDIYFFLGDICGYYYYQNDIIDVMRQENNMITIKGNHDDLFLNVLSNESEMNKYTKKYGKSCLYLKESIRSDNLDYLKGLQNSYILKEQKIALFHGSPWDNLNGYVYPDSDIEKFTSLDFNFVFLGHTHYKMDRKSGGVRVFNPGSCGQPRDKSLPSYAVVDLTSGSAKFVCVDYDKGRLIDDIKKRQEKYSYLIDVLKRG